ncbi:MAG: hypothetical protein GY898_02125 [Proteobacteria bacterium]|nr:hypothetical protein [Pseudomonadota bacterium]
MRRSCALVLLVLLGCKPDPESVPAPPPEPETPANFDELRAAENLGLLTSLVGEVDLGGYAIRSAHDLGTTRMVLLDRPEQTQTVSIIDMAPPEDLTADQLRAAFAGGSAEPLEVLGYDSVTVTEHREDSWARITWTRDGDSGEGTVRWMECDGRWLFVGEEITGGTWTADATAALVGKFQLCVR